MCTYESKLGFDLCFWSQQKRSKSKVRSSSIRTIRVVAACLLSSTAQLTEKSNNRTSHTAIMLS